MKRAADPEDDAIKKHEPVAKKIHINLVDDEEEEKHDSGDTLLEKEIQDIINGGVVEQQQQPIPPPVLSVSQKRALEMVRQGQNIFITGNAGSGKSFLIAAIMDELRALKKRFVLTASTGVAAWNIGGITAHSFAGMGLADKDIGVYTAGLKYRADKRKEWEDLDVLIVDEISMLSVEFLVKLDAMAKFARNKQHLPFGGLQIVLTGDYFQCPSVEKDFEEFDEVTGEPRPRFPFQAPLWGEARIQSIGLKENFRQQGDLKFFELLERIKVAKHTLHDEVLLETRLLDQHPDVNPTDLIKLCSRRATANAINMEELGKLKTDAHKFVGVIVQYDARGQPLPPNNERGGGNDNGKTERYPVDQYLTLKAGAEVLLCVNMSLVGLFNGSRGKVLDFRKDPQAALKDAATLYPFVEFDNGVTLLVTPYKWESSKKGRLVSTFTQVPIILRYAITIHKAQGLTLSKVLVMMDFFENGQGYVALSRVRQLADLYVANVDMSTIKASKAVIDFYTDNGLIEPPKNCRKYA